MTDVKEILRRFLAGESGRRAARECGADRKTVARYYEAAEACGLRPGCELTEELITDIARAVQSRPAPAPSEVWRALVPFRARIEAWLAGERPLRLVRIHELLHREGVRVSYNTLRRYVQLGTRAHGRGDPARDSVRVRQALHFRNPEREWNHHRPLR